MNLLFDREKLQKIIDSFYLVAGIHSVVYDDKGRGLAWSQKMTRSPLCALLRQNPEFDKLCIKSDFNACMRCKSTGKGEMYRCHIGLEEFVVPIFTESNLVVGYIVSGQLTPNGKREEALSQVIEKCVSYGISEEVIREAYYRHQEIEPKIMGAAFEILQACTAYVWMSKAASINEGNLAFKLSNYITSSLDNPLGTDEICAHFNISKTQLNRLSQEYFGQSLQSYIRRQRVDKSKELLVDTDLQISQIAQMVGIPDYNYFTKVFKSVEGCTPREYRKARQKQLSS